MMNCKQWKEMLVPIVANTEYEVLYNKEPVSGQEDIIIKKKNQNKPQYIKIYPKQSGTRIVLNVAVKTKVEQMMDLQKADSFKSNEYHYKDVSDDFVIQVCSSFVAGEDAATNVTEWFISGNPTTYDIEGAFDKLGKVDWKQSTNVAAGDIVYIYVSQGVYAVEFKCRANKVDIEEVDIDDQEFNLSGEYDGTYGRYMELEMLEKLNGTVYSKAEMEKHGFRYPQSPVRVTAQTKEYLDLVQKLQHIEEMDPDKHDGSYELMRETIRAYKNMGDLSICDYKDLNLVYLTCVGTWKQGIDAKKKTVNESHLPDVEKKRLIEVIDSVWNRTKSGAYTNHEGKGENFGMFGTGFYTFMGKTDDDSPRKFIQMCIDISDMADDDEIFSRCEETLNESFHGMRAASASMVLHCLKPMTFPIFNSNMGPDNIYVYFNLDIKWKTELYSYIKNARIVKKFRDENFTIKNYRIFDIAAGSLGSSKQHTNIDYLGVLDYLDNNREIPYSNPEAAGLDVSEKERLLGVKTNGQGAVSEMKKMVELCKEKFGLDRCEPMSWLDGSNTKTRKYLWAQMKYSKYADNPISISIFVEISPLTDKARYRYSLEIKNDGTDKNQMEKYHSHLDMALQPESSLVYVVGSNELGKPDTVDETAEEIKEKLKNGTYSKVQLCKIEEWTDSSTNDEFEAAMTEGIQELIPYYEYVLGMKNNDYWPSIDEYDPGITSAQWAEFVLEDSEKYISTLQMLLAMVDNGGKATCKHLSHVLSVETSACVSRGANFGRRAANYFDVEEYVDKEDGKKPFVTCFVGRYVDNHLYEWKLRYELKEALEMLVDQGKLKERMRKFKKVLNKPEYEKNMILYGPPGTGKTYNTAIYAVAICQGIDLETVKKMPYEDVMAEYEKLKKAGRIAFTTFHQSYGYEEFIEGIRPIVNQTKKEVGYTIEPGVFKKFCDNARTIENNGTGTSVNAQAQIWKLTIKSGDANPIKQECFDEGNARMGFDYDAPDARAFVEDVAPGDIILSFKTRRTIDGIAVVTGDIEELTSKDTYQLSRKVTWLAKDIDEDITGINAGKLLHRMTFAKVTNMQLKDILEIVEKFSTNDNETEVVENVEPYVFIIDEINRGNISKIFGELITLIENTKRAGMPEAASALLPYSDEPFSVPSNVYLLGTMNTADRSIALMDTALRRRFQFEEMMPNSQVLRDIQADTVEKDGVTLDVAEMLDTINQRIEYLFDREHTIGHAFFTELKDDATIEKLASIFMKSVIPLLEEYFYEDYSKIMLILGDNGKKDDKHKFIIAKETKANTIFRGDTSDIDIPDYSYEIQKHAFYDIMSYVEIKG